MAVLILPKLKIGSDVQPPSLGEWNEYPTAAFETIAKSLDYPAGGENQQINSVPTMWALPLTLEMPLYNPNHALHEQAVSQWQGMLAVIALAKVRSFPIQARELDINSIKSDPFAAALLDLLPTVDNALYALNDRSNPWRKVFIWTWNNKPVGMTSPSTIVAPAKPLLLIDPELTKIWDLAPQDIRIHKDRTLANFQIQDLKSGRIGNWEDVLCLEPKDLFLSELTFISGENALPGGSLPQSNQALNFKGDKITPLLPINPILLDYFTPAELASQRLSSENSIKCSDSYILYSS